MDLLVKVQRLSIIYDDHVQFEYGINVGKRIVCLKTAALRHGCKFTTCHLPLTPDRPLGNCELHHVIQ